MRDFEFIAKHPDYSKLVETIDAGDHNWLDFSIDEEAKVDLFIRGAKAAKKFMMTFKWEKYKEIRRHLIAARFASFWQNADEQMKELA